MKTLTATEQNELVQSFVTDITEHCKLLEALFEETSRIESTLTENELVELSDNDVYDRAVKNLGIAEALARAEEGF